MHPLNPQVYSAEYVRHGVNYSSRKLSLHCDAFTTAITPDQQPDIDDYDRDNIAELIEQIINAPPQSDQQNLIIESVRVDFEQNRFATPFLL